MTAKGAAAGAAARQRGTPVAAIRGVCGAVAADVDIDVAAGEVVGVTGLAGSGHDELPYLLTGARPAERGTLQVGATTLDLTRCDSAGAMAAGVALVPESRADEGLALDLTVADNISLVQRRSRAGGAPGGAEAPSATSSHGGCGSSTCGHPTRR